MARTPPECCMWPVRDINGLAVDFDADGLLGIRRLVKGVAVYIPRREARLLAKRINRALDYYQTWNKSKRRAEKESPNG